MDRLECGTLVFDVGSELDWRLQAAGLATGITFAELPHFGPYYTGNQTAFVSSWNTILSTMQYLLIASLVLIVLGIVWSGPIGRPSAWIQMFISFGLGCWMILTYVSGGFIAIDFRAMTPIVVPAETLLTIGLLVPALSFASSLTWLFWDGRNRLDDSVGISPSEIRRRQFAETSESIVASIVTPLMAVFGVAIIFVSPSPIFLIVGTGIISICILVFVLEFSRHTKGP